MTVAFTSLTIFVTFSQEHQLMTFLLEKRLSVWKYDMIRKEIELFTKQREYQRERSEKLMSESDLSLQQHPRLFWSLTLAHLLQV